MSGRTSSAALSAASAASSDAQSTGSTARDASAPGTRGQVASFHSNRYGGRCSNSRRDPRTIVPDDRAAPSVDRRRPLLPQGRVPPHLVASTVRDRHCRLCDAGTAVTIHDELDWQCHGNGSAHTSGRIFSRLNARSAATPLATTASDTAKSPLCVRCVQHP